MVCCAYAGGPSHFDLSISNGIDGHHSSCHCGNWSRVAELLYPMAPGHHVPGAKALHGTHIVMDRPCDCTHVPRDCNMWTHDVSFDGMIYGCYLSYKHLDAALGGALHQAACQAATSALPVSTFVIPSHTLTC